MKIQKLNLSQKLIERHFCDNLFIREDGSIVLKTRNNEIIFDRFAKSVYSHGKLRISYVKDRAFTIINFEFGPKKYSEPVVSAIVRSFLGHNFNSLRDYSGGETLDSIRINNHSLEWCVSRNNKKVSTKFESIFYDKWSSVLNEKDFNILTHGKYFTKWCNSNLIDFNYITYKQESRFKSIVVESYEAKAFKEKFLFYYRGILKKISIARAGLISEVPVFTKTDKYFLDFLVPSLGVVFEIDGNQHYTHSGIIEDSIRTLLINSTRKITLLRLPNKEVEKLTSEDMKNLLSVCYDKAGYLAVKAISGLEDRKFRKLVKIANRILKGKSAAAFENYHSNYIIGN